MAPGSCPCLGFSGHLPSEFSRGATNSSATGLRRSPLIALTHVPKKTRQRAICVSVKRTNPHHCSLVKTAGRSDSSMNSAGAEGRKNQLNLPKNNMTSSHPAHAPHCLANREHGKQAGQEPCRGAPGVSRGAACGSAPCNAPRRGRASRAAAGLPKSA